MDTIIRVEIALPASVRRDDSLWIASCPALDVCSQGPSREEALANLEDAVVFFVESCFERGTLFDVLREAGFERVADEQARDTSVPAGVDAISVRVPLPFGIPRRPDTGSPSQQR